MKIRAKALPSIISNSTLIKIYFDVDDGTKGYILDRVFDDRTHPLFFKNLLERDIRKSVIEITDGKVGVK